MPMGPPHQIHKIFMNFLLLDEINKAEKGISGYKLKKRVIRYFKVLQRNNKTPTTLLPGTRDMKTNYLIESELFRDGTLDDIDNNEDIVNNQNNEKIKEKDKRKNNDEIIEGFQNPVNNRAIYLILFGLFIIYTLDKSK